MRARLEALGLTGADVWELADAAASRLERLHALAIPLTRAGLLEAGGDPLEALEAGMLKSGAE